MLAVTTGLMLLAGQSGVVAADSRILVVSGSDTAAYAVGDTLRFSVGTPVQLITRLKAPNGTPLTVKWHNTSGGVLTWERRNGWFGEGAVTATRNGVGSFMAHWGDTEDTSIDLVFRASGGTGAPEAPDPRLDDTARAEVIDSLIATLDRAYVYPDVAARIASELRAQRSRGAYRGAGNPKTFAALLTEHVQAVSHDKHLRLGSAPPPGASRRRSGPTRDPGLRDVTEQDHDVQERHHPGGSGRCLPGGRQSAGPGNGRVPYEHRDCSDGGSRAGAAPGDLG